MPGERSRGGAGGAFATPGVPFLPV